MLALQLASELQLSRVLRPLALLCLRVYGEKVRLVVVVVVIVAVVEYVLTY